MGARALVGRARVPQLHLRVPASRHHAVGLSRELDTAHGAVVAADHRLGAAVDVECLQGVVQSAAPHVNRVLEAAIEHGQVHPMVVAGSQGVVQHVVEPDRRVPRGDQQELRRVGAEAHTRDAVRRRTLDLELGGGILVAAGGGGAGDVRHCGRWHRFRALKAGGVVLSDRHQIFRPFLLQKVQISDKQSTESSHLKI